MSLNAWMKHNAGEADTGLRDSDVIEYTFVPEREQGGIAVAEHLMPEQS